MARSGVIYGPTGSRKTTQVKRFAHYIARKTGKSTLLLSCDGGGWSPCEPEIQVGMILPYRVEMAVLPLIILRKISQGYWPADANETDPEKINLIPIDWGKVGGIAVEGWSSISAAVMRYLPDKGLNVGGEDRSKLGVFSLPLHVNGGVISESFGSNTRGDYGFVQRYLYGFVMNLSALPCEYVLYTALESKTEDDDRATTYGPAIAGKKATAECGSWVGDMIHAQDYPVQRLERVPNPAKPGETVEQTILDMTVRFHFMKHPDPVTSIPFPAKPRVTPEKVGELAKRFPGGFFEPKPDGTDSFDAYLDVLDALSVGQADSLRDWRKTMDAKLGRKPLETGDMAMPTPVTSSK